MYNRKHIKPDLFDAMIGKKIIKTLKPPADDYWEPTRNGLSSVWENYIRPNIWFIVGVVVVLVFLIYRYRSIKAEREAQKVADVYKSYYGPYVGPNGRRLSPENWSPSEYIPGRPKTSMDQYADMVLEIYNYQKENAREPKTTAWDPNPQAQARTQTQAYPQTQSYPQAHMHGRATDWVQPYQHQYDHAPSYSRPKAHRTHVSPRAQTHRNRSPRGIPVHGSTSGPLRLAYPMYPYEGGTLTPSGMY